MKKIWTLLREHFRVDFSWPLYLSIALFLVVGISINYTINLENGIIDKATGKPIRIVWYFLLYGATFYGATLITFFFTDKIHYFRVTKFWVISLTGLIILSCNVGFPYMTPLIKSIHDDYNVFAWLFRVGNNVINFFITAIPLFLFARVVEDKRENFGVNRHHIDLQPYYQILLVIVPIIAIASFEHGFKNYYPTYKTNNAAEVLGWPEFVPPLIYEFAYGIDFFNVEFMFRGLLVIGLSQVIGKEAILPMVCTYCALHFGKPIGESISSIFGGYILGVVAFYTRNIWGGVMVHVGLAWMMEVGASIQNLVQGN
jgi:hypothetical protein